MSQIVNYIKLLRVNQWMKNFFIFAPVFFAFKFTDINAIINLCFAFVGFSFTASAVYIINDRCDIEADRLHPKKKYRPLASGAVSKKEAAVILSLLLVAGIAIYVFVIADTDALLLLVAYFIMNIAYSLKLKQFAIIDVTIVAIGFVIRLFIGSFVSGVHLSYWIIILTFLLALLLVLGKRRNDITILEETGKQMRKSLNGYNAEFLNAIIIVVVTAIIIGYILYTISPEVVARNGNYMYLTSLFVILGLFRYLQVLFVYKKGDSPTSLILKDRFLQIDIACWAVSFVGIYMIEKM
ncbi:MAG: decaprenyl-phosphate phosphoribosyltransferase [Dysgonomonas sp.]